MSCADIDYLSVSCADIDYSSVIMSTSIIYQYNARYIGRSVDSIPPNNRNSRWHPTLSRGTKVIRTYDAHKNLYTRYSTIFNNNIWSYLPRSPLIVIRNDFETIPISMFDILNISKVPFFDISKLSIRLPALILRYVGRSVGRSVGESP